MAVCSPGLTGMINLDPDCNAQKQIGGVNKRLFIGSLADLAGYTPNASGEVTSIAMKVGKKMYALSGKKLRNNAASDAQVSETATLFGHTVNFIAYVNTQEQKNAIEKLARLDDLFIIVPLNYGRQEIYGLIGDDAIQAQGLSLTALAHNTGTALQDDTSYTLTFSGAEAKLPVFANFGETQTAQIAFMEGLLTAAV